MAAALHKHFIQAYPFFMATYSKAAKLWARKSSTGPKEIIYSEEGAMQGDPQAMFLFSNTTQEHVVGPTNEAIWNHPDKEDGMGVHFADDGSLVGTPAACAIGYEACKRYAAETGLKLNESKCVIFNPHSLQIPEGVFHPEIKVLKDALPLLGGVIGNKQGIADFLEEKLAALEADMKKVVAYPNTQNATTIFRLCICSRVNYLLRILPPTSELRNGDSLSVSIDKMLRRGVEGLLSTNRSIRLTDDGWTQMKLPLRLGGMGYLDAPRIHVAAHIASKVECHSVVQAIFDAVGRGLGKPAVISSLKTDAQVAHSSLTQQYPVIQRDKKKPIEILPWAEVLRSEGGHLQMQLCKPMLQHHFHTLQRSIAVDAANRMDSCAREGSYVIAAIAKDEHTTIPSVLFRGIVCMRNGLDIEFIPEATACSCSRSPPIYMDKKGNHLATCHLRNNLNQRHNAVRDVLAQCARAAGLITRSESGDTLRIINPRTQQRFDITIPGGGEGGRTLEGDIAVVNPRALAHAGKGELGSRLQPETAAKRMENAKRKKYEKNCEMAGAVLVPLVMESYGRWGPSLRKWFKQLMRRMAMFTDKDEGILSAYWGHRIAIAMHRAAMSGMFDLARQATRTKTQAEDEEKEDEDMDDYGYVSVARF